jgi:predicted transcriptional regulator
MKKPHRLTDLQTEVMDVVWSRGQATVGDVHEALAETKLARKTIGTLLFRLEKQGLLAHREEGREYVYLPLVTRDEVERATMVGFLSGLFRGDVPAMISRALEAQDVEPGDVEEIRRLLDEWEARQGRSG